MATFAPAQRVFSVLLLCALCSVLAHASSAQLTSFPLKDDETLLHVVPRPRGGTYLIIGNANTALLALGSRPGTSVTDGALLGGLPGGPIQIVRLDANGAEAARIVLNTGPSSDTVRAITAPDGSLYLLGTLRSPDLQTVAPLFDYTPPRPGSSDAEGEPEGGAPVPPGRIQLPPAQGFLVKTNSAGTAVERATYLGGVHTRQSSPGTMPKDMVRDLNGNIYITGSTSHHDFPVTPNAAKTDSRLDLAQKSAEGFLMKVDGGLNRLIYSTFFGTDSHVLDNCQDTWSTIGVTLRIGTQNQPIVYAATNGMPIPSSEGAYSATDMISGTPACYPIPQQTRSRFLTEPSATLLRFDSTGSSIVAASYIGKSTYVDGASMLQQQSNGQLVAVLSALPTQKGRGLQFLKLDQNLSTLVSETTIDISDNPVILHSVTQQPDGSLWLSGEFHSSVSQSLSGAWGVESLTNLGNAFVLNVDGFRLQPRRSWLLPHGITDGEAVADEFALRLTSPSGVVFSLPITETPDSLVMGVANAAGTQVKPSVSPYELMSIYGVGLGPESTEGIAFSRNGTLPTAHEGVRVLMNGVAAPLLYVGASQINLVAPASIASLEPGSPVAMKVERDGQVVAEAMLFSVPASPHVFVAHQTAETVNYGAFHQDGSVNTFANPAKAGDVVSFYWNGAGAPEDLFPAGKRVDEARPWSRYQLRLLPPAIAAIDAEQPSPNVPPATEEWSVQYFGSAPGMVSGALQLNIQVPSLLQGNPFVRATLRPVTAQLLEGSDPDAKVLAQMPVWVWVAP